MCAQEDNVKRKASKQAAEQQAKRQKDSKGKPRAAGRTKQWWEPEGGPAQPDDDRKFYMEEVRESRAVQSSWCTSAKYPS